MKVILNKCYGGFGLSGEAIELYFQKKNMPVYLYKHDFTRKNSYIKCIPENTNEYVYCFNKDFGDRVKYFDIDWKYLVHLNTDDLREDIDLIEIVEKLGKAANGRFADLKVVDIPDELKGNYVIDDYDGIETLHEDIRVW